MRVESEEYGLYGLLPWTAIAFLSTFGLLDYNFTSHKTLCSSCAFPQSIVLVLFSWTEVRTSVVTALLYLELVYLQICTGTLIESIVLILFSWTEICTGFHRLWTSPARQHNRQHTHHHCQSDTCLLDKIQFNPCRIVCASCKYFENSSCLHRRRTHTLLYLA